MKNNKTVWIMILVFVLLIGGAYVLYNQLGSRMDMPQLATQSGQAQDEAGDNQAEAGESEDKAESALAPDFTVYDLNGNPVKLSDYRGKPVVLNFWSSRCGPCQMEMPDFQEAYEDLGEEIHFLMDDILSLLHHLSLSNPQRSRSSGHSKIIDLDAVELMDTDSDPRIVILESDDHIILRKDPDNFILQSSERKESLGQEVTGAASWIQELQ